MKVTLLKILAPDWGEQRGNFSFFYIFKFLDYTQLGSDSLFYAQGSFIMGLKGPLEVLGIDPYWTCTRQTVFLTPQVFFSLYKSNIKW